MLRILAHHHRGNGILERFQKTIVEKIRVLRFERRCCWTRCVKTIISQIRNMEHKTLGKTPAQVLQETPND